MKMYNDWPNGCSSKQCNNCKYHVRRHNERIKIKRHKCLYIHEYIDPKKIYSCDNFVEGYTKHFHQKRKGKKPKRLTRKQIIAKKRARKEERDREKYGKKIEALLKKMSND